MAPLPVCEGAFLMAQVVKNLLATQEILGLIPGSGRFPGEGNDNPLQNSCRENFMHRGAWWAAVHGVTKSWICLSTHGVAGSSKPKLCDKRGGVDGRWEGGSRGRGWMDPYG